MLTSKLLRVELFDFSAVIIYDSTHEIRIIVEQFSILIFNCLNKNQQNQNNYYFHLINININNSVIIIGQMQSNSLIIPQIQIQLLNKQEVNVIFQLEVQLENETDELTINLIVKTLKNMGFPLRNQFIMYTSQAYNINILCGYDPFNSNIVLQKEDYQKGLIISVIDSQKPLINQLV